MAILVDIFSGDTEQILSSLRKEDWNALQHGKVCSGQVSFKFYLNPEDALNALVRTATNTLNRPNFKFEDLHFR